MLHATPSWAGFNFGECAGSGKFEQQIEHYGGDYENAVKVGEIPQGIIGLKIELISNKDVDIRLYGENNDKIVHWPNGILHEATQQTKPYKSVDITYSGYDGSGGFLGHEFIKVLSSTPTAMVMKAFGYQSGYATVNYSWTGKATCETPADGSGHFKQDILYQNIKLVGKIPSGINNLNVNLTSEVDIDIQLYGADGTAIVKWPDGVLKDSDKQEVDYHGMHIEWSGYDGTNGSKGHEYIKVTPKSTETLTMKVFGYKAGYADVDYTWGKSKREPTIRNWVRTNPGAGGALSMIGATASGALLVGSDLSGIYINHNGTGDQWSPLGEVNGLMNTHVSAFGFHPTNGDTFYVGTGGGLYKTINKGQHFDFVSSNITVNNGIYKTSNSDNTYVESIAISKTDPMTIYATYHKWETSSPSSIAKSNDGGQTWSNISFPLNLTPPNLRIVKLLVHPQDGNLIYAIAGMPRWGCSAAKAYRSTDGGINWSMLDDKGDVLDLDIDFSNKNILYMSTFSAVQCKNINAIEGIGDYVKNDEDGQATNGNLYKSTNQGASFGGPIFNKTGIISIGTKDSNNIKLINTLTFQNAFWMDEDETGTWENNSAGAIGSTWSHIGSVKDWNLGYSNNPYVAFQYSFNGLNKTLTKDIFNSDRLYGAGALTLGSFDGGRTFNSLSTRKKENDSWISTGLDNINGFALDVNDADKNIIYIGGYDIGFWVSKNRGLSWKWQYPFKKDLETLNRYTWGATNVEPEAWKPDSLKTIGGSNTMTLVSDPSRANVVWSSFAKSQIFANAVTDNDPSKNDRSGLFRSTDYGDTWTLSRIYKKDGTLLSTHYHAIIYGLSVDKASPSDTRTLYVTIDGHVAKSTDDGQTWHIIHEDGGLKFTAIGNNILYAGGKSGLWRFKNNVWTQMGGSLKTEMMGVGIPMTPDLAPQKDQRDESWKIVRYAWNGVHDIKIDPSNQDVVYVTVYGEGKGLYKTIDGGNSWNKVNLGVFESRYLRYIAIDPQNTNTIFVTSSENISSGGTGGISKGIFYTTDGGSSWQDANTNMAWKFGSMIKIDNLSERVWAWSPGTGVQYMEIKE